MNDSLLMRLHNIRRQQKSLCDILADLTCHVVTLYAVDRRVFVGIFLFGLFVVAFDQRKDPGIRGVGFADQRALIAVLDIVLCEVESAGCHARPILLHLYST